MLGRGWFIMNTTHKIGLVAIKALFGLSLVVGTVVSPALHHHVRLVTAAPACYEDDPCWDCRVMGNGICGTEA